MTLALHAQGVLAALAPGARKSRDAADASGADSAFGDALAQQSDDAAPTGAAPADATAWRGLAVPASGSAKTSAKADFTPTRVDAGALLARNMAAARLGASSQPATGGAAGSTPDTPAPEAASSETASSQAASPEAASSQPASPQAASPQAASDAQTFDWIPKSSKTPAAKTGAVPATPRAGPDVGSLTAAPPSQTATSDPAGNASKAGTHAASQPGAWASRVLTRAAASSTSTARQTATPEPGVSTSKAASRGSFSPASDADAGSELDSLAAPSAAGELQLAALLASAPTNPARTPQPEAPTTDADSVARIGAALADASLASASLTSAASGLGSKTRIASPDLSLATDDKPKAFVHVVSQQTWLPPVGAGLSPSHSTPTPDHLPGNTGETKTSAHPEAAVVEAKAQPPAPLATTLGSADLARSLPPLATVSGAPARDGTSATAAASSAAAPQDPEPSAPPMTTRRDLEITLEPQELGGLQVRMKSAGDRLEIAFVADRGETARLIADKSVTLEGQLHQAGLGLGGIDISTAARPTATGDSPQSFSGSASTGGGAARDDAGAQPQRQSAFAGPNQDQRQEQSHDKGDRANDPQSAPGARGLYL